MQNNLFLTPLMRGGDKFPQLWVLNRPKFIFAYHFVISHWKCDCELQKFLYLLLFRPHWLIQSKWKSYFLLDHSLLGHVLLLLSTFRIRPLLIFAIDHHHHQLLCLHSNRLHHRAIISCSIIWKAFNSSPDFNSQKELWATQKRSPRGCLGCKSLFGKYNLAKSDLNQMNGKCSFYNKQFVILSSLLSRLPFSHTRNHMKDLMERWLVNWMLVQSRMISPNLFLIIPQRLLA